MNLNGVAEKVEGKFPTSFLVIRQPLTEISYQLHCWLIKNNMIFVSNYAH